MIVLPHSIQIFQKNLNAFRLERNVDHLSITFCLLNWQAFQVVYSDNVKVKGCNP